MLRKVLSVLCMLLITTCMMIPVYGVDASEDGYMGVNENIEREEVPLKNARAMITNGWYYENGIKYFKDNNGTVMGSNVKKVIDVSLYNGTIDWKKVSETDVDGAILRIVRHPNGEYLLDTQFENNLAGCRKYNIPFGIYIYDYSNSVQDASDEADMIIGYLKQYEITPDEMEYPVYLDMERDKISAELNAQIVDMFINKLVEAGYNAKVYSYRALLQTNLNNPIIYQHVNWVAAYTNSIGFSNPWYTGVKGWQYSNYSFVDGIDGGVDMSVFYDHGQTVSKYYGWHKWGGQWYYGNQNGILQIGWEYINDKWYYLNINGVMQTGWQFLNGNWYYLNVDGDMAIGLNIINSNGFYFDDNGVMQTGWQQINGNWYYFNASGYGVRGWQRINGVWYYFDENCKMQTGWQKISGKWYYFAPGYMNVNNKSYYEGYMLTGWQQINGNWFYFNSNGVMLTGWQKISGNWYYFAPGYMNVNGISYYEGYMVKGIAVVDGNYVYLNKDGIMQTGWQYVNNTWYYFNASGYGVRGWQYINRKWYYFDNDCKMLTGWITVNNQTYYLSSSGAMVTGTVNINGTTYTFSKSGALI